MNLQFSSSFSIKFLVAAMKEGKDQLVAFSQQHTHTNLADLCTKLLPESQLCELNGKVLFKVHKGQTSRGHRQMPNTISNYSLLQPRSTFCKTGG